MPKIIIVEGIYGKLGKIQMDENLAQVSLRKY